MTMKATLTACDKDSSAGFINDVEFKDKEEFLKFYKGFEQAVPFHRWYLDMETDDDDLVESWLEELEN